MFYVLERKNIDWIGILYWNTGFKNEQILVFGICLKITHKMKKTWNNGESSQEKSTYQKVLQEHTDNRSRRSQKNSEQH